MPTAKKVRFKSAHLTAENYGHQVAKLQERAEAEMGKGNPVRVVLVDADPKRTVGANAYYFGVLLTTAAKFLGYPVSDLHEILVEKFLGYTTVTRADGKEVTKLVSTSALGVKAFDSFCRQCEDWVTNFLGLSLPPRPDLTEDEQLEVIATTI